MNADQHAKIRASHLARSAYLYVRQSTLRQVLENTESTKRQYALRERAIALGWPGDRIVIIDHGSSVAAGTPAELMNNGAEGQLRFTAPRRLDLSLLVSALPENYSAKEVSPGEYLVEGQIDPQVLATVTGWCARLNVLATDVRVEQRSLEDVFLDLTGRELRP